MNQVRSDRAIRSIAVVGGGIVGLSAAIAFARALPGIRITLVETPFNPAALADRMPGTLPSVGRFHALIGLEELSLVRSGAALHRLGTRFERWSADGAPWLHVFGDYCPPGSAGTYPHLWAAARRAGWAEPYHRLAAAAALGDAGKFAHPTDDTRSPLSSFDYALQLDPQRYHEQLIAIARRLPIARVGAEIGEVDRRPGGGVERLRLSDGGSVTADLFIDAAGPASPLFADAPFEDWSAWLPADRLLIGGASPPSEPSPMDRVIATAVGWRAEVVLPDRTLHFLAWAASATGESRARRVLAAETTLRDTEAIAIRPGRLLQPWRDNLLAIGDAAVAVDPLEATNLHLAHSTILCALELLPGRDFHPLEIAEYNRRIEQEAVRVRDFLALHYLRSGRSEGEFWTGLAARSPPPTLARTVEQFERRGRLPFFEEEAFDKESWFAALLGMGVLPHMTDAVAAGLESDRGFAEMRRFAEALAALPARLPSYRAYLARMVQAPSPPGRRS